MSWYTLKAATRRGPSERAWMQRVLAGEVSSYVDGRGQRRVWIEDAAIDPTPWHVESAVLPLGREVSSLRRELEDLRGSVSQAKPARHTLSEHVPRHSAPPAPPPAPKRSTPPAPQRSVPLAIELLPPLKTPGPHQTILDLVAASWSGSDRELEREAALPKAFLAKAKRGLRNGPKSAKSWERLEEFLRARERVRHAA